MAGIRQRRYNLSCVSLGIAVWRSHLKASVYDLYIIDKISKKDGLYRNSDSPNTVDVQGLESLDTVISISSSSVLIDG